METPLKSILIAVLLIPVLSYGQTYRTDLQLDLVSTGNEVVGYEKGTLIFSKEKGEFSIKFDNLRSIDTYKISYAGTVSHSDRLSSTYEIVGDLTYNKLLVDEYDSPVKINGTYYSELFTIIGMNDNNEVNTFTKFYAYKK